MGSAFRGDPARDLPLLLGHSAPPEIDHDANEKDAKTDRLLKFYSLVVRHASAEIIFKSDEADPKHHCGNYDCIADANAVAFHNAPDLCKQFS
jgi:hypothetical protein